VSAGRLDFGEDTIDMSRGPADGRTAPSGIRWDKDADAPVSGNTPAARQASATGAQMASKYRNSRAQQLLLFFYEKGRLTIAEAATLLNVKEGSVTGPWNKLEHTLGWIKGTGDYFTWHSSVTRKPVRREYHVLTAEGRSAAIALKHRRDNPEVD
jgi:hypothetical protein